MSDTNNTIKDYSFQNGFDQGRSCDQEQLRIDLMAARCITSNISWMKCKRGETKPSIEHKEAIDKVFAKYGITKEIWGYEINKRDTDNAGV